MNKVDWGKIALRPELLAFAEQMEKKLRKNDHKRGWREQPIEALFRLLKIEVQEFEVADEFFTVAEARNELVDIANFAMMLHDRLGMIEQDIKRSSQLDRTEKPLLVEDIGNGSIKELRK